MTTKQHIDFKESLHQLEQSVLTGEPYHAAQVGASSLYDEGYKIIRTVQELTEDNLEFSNDSIQAFRDGLLLMMLEALQQGSPNQEQAFGTVEEIVRLHCLQMLSLFEDKSVDEVERIFEREGETRQLLHNLVQRFQSLCTDEERGANLACMDESYIYAISRFAKLNPEQPITNDWFMLSEQNMSSCERLCELFRADSPLQGEMILGLPADVAYRIGMCYYQGSVLPLDHLRANYWLGYAATIGYPQARLAYTLFFADIMLYGNEVFDEYLAMLKLIYQETVAIRKGLMPFFVVDLHYTCQGEQRDFAQDMLCNVTYLLLAKLKANQDYFDSDLGADYNFLVEDLVEAALEPQSYKVRAALARLLFCSRGFMQHYMKVVMVDHKLVDDPNLSLEECIWQLLGKGVQAGDYECLLAYNHLRLYNNTDLKQLKYLKALADLGDAKALFAYAGYLWSKPHNSAKERAKAQLMWQEAASKGLGAAQSNLVIHAAEQGKLQQSRAQALLSLDSGVMLSFYTLSKVCVYDEPELAHTYLRYAAAYMLPMAITELKELKSAGKYKPLPFMRTLEKIEQLAENNAHAAMIMSSLYFNSGLLPYDPYQVLHWMRKAVLLGEPDALENLNDLYSSNALELRDPFYLKPLSQTLAENLHYLRSQESETLELADQRLIALLGQCYTELQNGKTEFEQELLVQSLKHEFWEIDNADKLKKVLKKHRNHNYYYGVEQWLRLMTGNERPLDFESYQAPLYNESRVRKLLAALETARISKDDQRPTAAAVRAMLSVRSCTLPCNLQSFYQQVELGANGQEEFCTYMEHQNYDILGVLNLGLDAVNQLENEHVFITGVEQ